MSHHETLQRMNSELNTAETWARRWQIEREENERLNAEAGMVRARVREMRARAVEGYGRNQREASAAIGAGNHSRAEALDRACASGMGAVRALDAVLEMMDRTARHDCESIAEILNGVSVGEHVSETYRLEGELLKSVAAVDRLYRELSKEGESIWKTTCW